MSTKTMGSDPELKHAKTVFLANARALKKLARDPKHRNALVFVVASAFIEYLSKLVFTGTGAKEYKKFVRSYLARTRKRYRTFTYRFTGAPAKRDLPEQMYHVLRCGAVHGYSLVPDQRAIAHGGRTRSIVVAHRISKNTHLSLRYLGGQPTCVFIAEDFAADIEATVQHIISEARKNKALAKRIADRMRKHPPIQGGFALTAKR
ncbi:MAG TPA: hypothetical protein VI504_10805 [Candidatus Eisenbacteria bacterium]